MIRNILNNLKTWQYSTGRMPLLLQGARQVGKTWILKEFGNQQFENTAYLSLDQDIEIHDFFNKTKDPKRIIDFLSLHLNQPIIPGKTLLILDEIQECNSALNSLKYFCESMPELHVAASGSFLGVSLSQPGSFPVGKVNFFTLYPMSFVEFLLAEGANTLANVINEATLNTPLPEIIISQLNDVLKRYWVIGGMPAVVKSWVEQKNFELVDLRQKELLLAYERDFSKYTDTQLTTKLWQVWDSIPTQLARENKKFQFATIKKGARAKNFEDAVTWLSNAGLIHKVTKVNKPGFPIRAYEDNAYFKIYMLDTGLLRAKSELPPEILMKGDAFFTEFKGSLVENYTAQELIAHGTSQLHYWTSGAMAEVDFITSSKNGIVPIEVKSGKAVKSKSMKVYLEKYQQPYGIRYSMLNNKDNGGIRNVHLSLISLGIKDAPNCKF